jgi:uncharacterized FlgJ-related protein
VTNDQTIYETALSDGMPDPLAVFIVAQARHETGNYTSSFFTTGKNAFGYSYVAGAKWQMSTPGTNADNGLPVAQYSTVQNSVHELTDWIKRRQAQGKFPANLGTITTPQQYAQLLKNAGYYGDTVTNYTNGLVHWITAIGDTLLKPAGITIAILLIIVAALFRKNIFPSK